MKPRFEYSERVDKHIYGINGCLDTKDFIDLSIAALDQAGFSVAFQEAVKERIEHQAYSEGIL
jgi:hypothetical protein